MIQELTYSLNQSFVALNIILTTQNQNIYW
jgi:hypothetical protein